MEPITKKGLELLLDRLERIVEPKVLLEQYATPSKIAADILFLARNNIYGKTVADLGCGNGIFGIGAKILGAKKVYCVEIDRDSIEVAKNNAKLIGLEMEFLNMDVKNFNIKVDTILENPPFGYQFKNADLPFIIKSLELSNIFYLLHHTMAKSHLLNVIQGKGDLIMEKNYKFNLPYTFKFHQKEESLTEVTLYVVKVRK